MLALGDVFGEEAVKYLTAHLPAFCRENKIDFTVANCENASGASGVEPDAAADLLSAGCDVLTGGNHTFGRRAFYEFLDTHGNVLRPANYPPSAPGYGYCIARAGDGSRVLVCSVRGNLGFDSLPLACPFDTMERILAREAGSWDYAVCDFHAEYTSEKRAFGIVFDGKLSAVFGTHTHVRTADCRVLEKGTGYITDLGMCGPENSVLGVEPDAVIKGMREKLPVRFTTAAGPVCAEGAIFELTPAGCTAVRGISF